MFGPSWYERVFKGANILLSAIVACKTVITETPIQLFTANLILKGEVIIA